MRLLPHVLRAESQGQDQGASANGTALKMGPPLLDLGSGPKAVK